MNEFIGKGRRHDDDGDRDDQSQMSIVLKGTKVPLAVVIAGFASMIASIIFATVWMTKLDDRVLTNATLTGENREAIERIQNTNAQIVRQVDHIAITAKKTAEVVKEIQQDFHRHAIDSEKYKEKIRQLEEEAK